MGMHKTPCTGQVIAGQHKVMQSVSGYGVEWRGKVGQSMIGTLNHMFQSITQTSFNLAVYFLHVEACQ